MESDIQLSIVIVNYNVEFFLEQCLNSVFKALIGCRGEVFVVDNNSFDGSMKMVREKFPEVKTIQNNENVGFSKANNQAIYQSSGKYVLLLNPDTVVEENTFKEVIDFMDNHPDAGGLGVRMLDGKGHFLPESKRGVPTPLVAFYKIFGLSALFPKSKKFGKYHLGYLSEFETNEIEILSGAFMLMRKETLDKVGLLDEDFFMYGEDIDLSYRILLGGYKNYYFPETRIIHYKGESTKKSSVNYVFVFYRAMIIFAKKHFSKKHVRLFSFAINFAIYLRAFLAISMRVLKKSVLPTIDFSALTSGGFLLAQLWKYREIKLDWNILKFIIPSYAVIWMVSILYCGGYDKNKHLRSFLKGTVVGTIIILSVYALFPKDIQFSRIFILLSSVFVFSYYLLSRLFLSIFNREKYSLFNSNRKRFLIVGEIEESQRVETLLNQMRNDGSKCYFLSETDEIHVRQIGKLNQIALIITEYHIDEVVFCAKHCSSALILEWMNRLNHLKIDFKIAQPDTTFIIGSNSIHDSGDLYSLDINNINTEKNIRNKRTFDVVTAFLLLITFPIYGWFQNKKVNFARNLFHVLFGKKSFVGYHYQQEDPIQTSGLPYIKKGILTPYQEETMLSRNRQNKMNLIYARDYSIYIDFQIVSKYFRKLGN